MLDIIQFNDFKSYRTAVLDLGPLTLLVGAHAAGKTNCIEALRFLARLAHGQQLDDILAELGQKDLAIRGRAADIVNDQRAFSSIGFCVWLSPPTIWNQWQISLDIGSLSEGSTVSRESLWQGSNEDAPFLYSPQYDYKGEGFQHEIQVAYEDFEGAAPPVPLACSNRRPLFTQLDVPSRFASAKARQVIPEAVATVQRALRSILFLDLNPRVMSGYGFISDKSLRPDGSNLSSVLYDICVTQGRKQEVLNFMEELLEQDIDDIVFFEGPRQDVLVQLVETFGRRRTTYEAPLLSDGTLRMLGLAAALLSAPAGGLVVAEEIDNGLHPNRVRTLFHNMLTAAKANGLRVLLTSHHPALLEALPPESVPNVVCCYRDPKEGDSRLISLAKLADYPELVASGPLRQLLTQGLLERYLKSQRIPELKIEQAQEWLRQLQLDPDEDQ